MTVKRTSRIYVAWQALYDLIETVVWPGGPNGERPVMDWGDDWNQPAAEGWFVAGAAPESAATREWVTMGAPSQEERFVLRLTMDTQIPGRSRPQAMARIRALSDAAESVLRDQTTGRPAGLTATTVPGLIDHTVSRVEPRLSPTSEGFVAEAHFDIAARCRI